MLLDKIKLESDETVIVQTRRHWFVLIMHLFGVIIAALIPLFLYYLLITYVLPKLSLDLSTDSHTPYLTYLYSFWLLILWMGAFNIWTNYYLDIFTLTNRRVILINQKGFFRRYTASFRLERLQDMNVEINGILATFLDFGTISAETAGHAEEEFRAYGMAHPRELKAEVIKATDAVISEYRSRPISTDGV